MTVTVGGQSRPSGALRIRYADGWRFVFDTGTKGNSNGGHEYGASELSAEQKRELIEYLKTL